MALRNHKTLVSGDNKILSDEGKIKGSDIEKIVEYLEGTKRTDKAPAGTGFVLKFIAENNLDLHKLIKNPEALEKMTKFKRLSWIEASNFSRTNITRRNR